MSPFKFLDAYDREDKEKFFGREKETAQLYNAVFASNITLLYGLSGTGKTSLVNCGLGNKFYDTDWLPIFIRRGTDINASLHKELKAKLLSDPGENFDSLTISEKIHKLYQDHYKPIYLIFDQFEEIFTIRKRADGLSAQQLETEAELERTSFYQSIASLQKSGQQAKIILIMREEWLGHLDQFERYVPSLQENRLRVEKMTDPNVYRVIAGTCRYAGIPVETPGVTILNIIKNLHDKDNRVDLTNLQVYLDKLYREAAERVAEKKSDSIYFDPALVQEVGKIDNVISEFLDEQMNGLEGKLSQKGVSNTKGLPLEILFTLVTDKGTKHQLSPDEIHNSLPKNRRINTEFLQFCMEEFKRLKLVREVE